jgi:sarcosine oxidase subunit alpha
MINRNRLFSGGLIDRNILIKFKFNGKPLQGYQGDTLASALLANDIHLVGRSFKYHRPRGILTSGSEEPNALVQLGKGAETEPNARATEIELYDGLEASSQNCWPSVNHDIGALNNLFSRILPAGFYYKTFMWPPSMWMFYEYFIRRAAGLGEAPKEKNPSRYEQKFFYCDVTVVGAGVNGLTAALTAARAGASVLLVDEKPELGGYLLNAKSRINNLDTKKWIKDTVKELMALENVTVLNRTAATGYYDYNYVTALQKITNHLPNSLSKQPRERFWRIRSKEVILAQGAFERPLVFSGNDRPGIMMASSAQTYVNQYGVLPGNAVTLFTNNDHAYSVAVDLISKGAKVIIVDIRSNISEKIRKLCEQNKIETYISHAVIKTDGSKKISSITVQELSEDKQSFVGEAVTIGTDLLLMSGGWNPAVQLFSQSRGKLKYDDQISSFIPDVLVDNQAVIGSNNGDFNLKQSLMSSYEAGLGAAHRTGNKQEVENFINDANEPIEFITAEVVPYVLGSKPVTHGSKHFIDFQNDVTAADIFLAQREGYVSVEHTKRYTTTGMATDQGKTSNVNALALMSHIQQKPVGDVGHTTFRPPYVPQTFGAIAGRNVDQYFDPQRLTAIHEWHIDNGAVFEDVGQWKRPYFYPKKVETMTEAVNRECIAARASVGILDASTLGKIDIQGPDAAKFLNLIYTNAWSKLEIGACRYGLMCNEHGMVFDDGVTTRLGENHYHMTTTTGGAARVMSWLEEFLQTEWLDMKVYCTSVTEQWTVLSICGPNSRKLLASLTEDDISNEELPYMRMKEAKVCGVDARIFRISFTGELSFEINVSARYGRYVWDKVIEAGKKFNITPYGTETMHVLRAEKGFIIVGQDTDGSATPSDLNMDWIVSKKKEDFLGKRSFLRPDTAKNGRKQLVGLLINDKKTVVPEGSHIVEEVSKQPPMKMEGHITSSYFSPTLGHPIAMAMLKNGKARNGDLVKIPLMNGKVVEATVTENVFYDKVGARQND